MNYEKFWKPYLPEQIDILFVAESPPHIKKPPIRYFYNRDCTKGDSLFRNLIEVLFPGEYDRNKSEMLEKFKVNNYFLIDAVEYPINHIKSKRQRNKAVEENVDDLMNRIKRLPQPKGIVLIKKNVYEILYQRLENEGFNVLNKEFVNFPSHGNQRIFREKISKIL